jgi:hypothetical protein
MVQQKYYILIVHEQYCCKSSCVYILIQCAGNVCKTVHCCVLTKQLKLWIKFLILVVCINNGEYEKQQSVNLMYISMERMCIHVSLVFLMF